MPDEFETENYKNFKSIEEFEKSLEGMKYLHSLYLKAVNHPIRKEILIIINQEKEISRKKLLEKLIQKKIIQEESQLNYNIDYLIKALCINSIIKEETGEIIYQITQSGKVINYLGR